MDDFDKKIVQTKIRKLESLLHELHSYLESRIEPDVIYPATEKTMQGILMFKRIVKD